MRNILTLLLCWMLGPLCLVAQPVASSNGGSWSISMEPVKRFIENKSQFDGKNEQPGSNILYGVDWGATQIYFTNNGLTYRFEKKKFGKEEEQGRERKKIEGKYFTEEDLGDLEVITDVTHLQWVNANPDAHLVALEPTDDYFSYAVGKKGNYKNINHIKGYSKLRYENLYPNIDVEYVFHPETGIKYTLLLHPGADISVVKMKYSGTDEVVLDKMGNVRSVTIFGDIVDQAPVTFYDGYERATIRSEFIVSGDKTVSFKLGKYDKRKAVIIDPWTVTPNMPSTNKAYYIRTDNAGNAYVYGGESPYRLQKYNSAGALQWNYNAPWSAANNWFGTLAVDGVGNSYITSGSSAIISKVNTNGGLIWSNTPLGFTDEFWAIAFNSDTTQMLVGGTRNLNGAAFDIDINTGAVLNWTRVATTVTDTILPPPFPPTFNPNEIRTICFSPNGNYYFLTLDTIGSITPNLTINYREKSYHKLTYYLPYGQGPGQGLNGIATSCNLLYTTDGSTLHRRDINNGTVLSTVIIPNGSKEINSGIATDSCGNVYVGAVTKIHKYDENLNLLATVNAPAEVYDVRVTNNGQVLACGNGFAMSVDMAACKPIFRTACDILEVSVSKLNALCNSGCTGTATANSINGIPPFTYSWSTGESTQSVSGLCKGTYVVTVIDAANRTAISSVIITEPSPFSVYVSSSSTGCSSRATATPSASTGPFNYIWSNGGTSSTITDLTTGTYAVTVYDANNCAATDSVYVIQTGFTVSTTSTNPDCSSCNGDATVAVSPGGNPPFAYIWSTGDTTPTALTLCPGVYSVTVTETGGGGGNGVFWTEDFTNGGAGWTLNLIGSGPNDANANLWIINNASDCSQCPVSGSGGNYLHITCGSGLPCTGNQGGCTYDQGIPFFSNSSTDKYVTSPNISTIGRTGITLSFGYVSNGEAGADYGLVRLSDNGGATWTDLPTQYAGTFTCTQATIPIPVSYENISDFRIAFRWVNNSNFTGSDPPFMIDDIELSGTGVSTACSSTSLVTLSSDNGPVITLDSLRNVSCADAGDGSINISVSGGTQPYSYSWTNGAVSEDISGLSGDLYVVIVTEDGGCASAFGETLTEPTSAISISGVTTNSGCIPSGIIDITVTGGTFPYTYSWTNGAVTQDINNVSAGNYSVTVTDNNDCAQSNSFSISGPPSVNVTLTVDSPSCQGVADGSISSNVSGGSAPYIYFWSNGKTDANIDSLDPGIYTVRVADENNCSVSATATVTAPNNISMIASITQVFCEDGNTGGIKLIPFGGTAPHQASWSSGQTGLNLTGLAPGVYDVTVTDSKGCTRDSTFSLTAVSAYNIEAIATDASCDGSPTGSLQVIIISGNTPPYSYTWSTGDTLTAISNVSPGIYTVSVTDNLGCLRLDTTEVFRGLRIQEIAIEPCPSTSNGSIIVTVSGGVDPYSYSWNTGATTPSLVNIGEGTYSLTVTDQTDCKGSDTIVVLTDTSNNALCDTLIIYDVFSPNGDGRNDLWVIDGVQRFPENEIQIFNRWGSVVFEAEPYNNDWDGTSKKGELLPSATYYFILKLNDGKESVYSGNITLLR